MKNGADSMAENLVEYPGGNITATEIAERFAALSSWRPSEPLKPWFFLSVSTAILDEGLLINYAWWAATCESIIMRHLVSGRA